MLISIMMFYLLIVLLLACCKMYIDLYILIFSLKDEDVLVLNRQ